MYQSADVAPRKAKRSGKRIFSSDVPRALDEEKIGNLGKDRENGLK